MNDRTGVKDTPFHEAVLAGLPDAVIVASPQGEIVLVNRATETLFGYLSSALVGQSILTLLPPDPDRRADPVRWLARWAAEPDFQQSRFLDLVARRKDAHELHVGVRVRSGTVDARELYFITVQDNTERRREQMAANAASLRAARILMVAEDAILSIDSEQKIIFVNPAAERMFGYSADEVLGQALTMLVPEAARSAHAGQVEAFGASRQASRMMSERSQVLGCRRTGEVFPLEATITKVQAAGALTYTAHLRDVTERNHARDQLQETERRIRAVFDHAIDALALLAPDGAVLEINQAGAALTMGGETLVGTPLWKIQWLGAAQDEVDTERLQAAIHAAAMGQAGKFDATLSRDGNPLPLEVHLTPISGPNGHISYVLVEGRLTKA